MTKTRLQISVDHDLNDFAQMIEYIQENPIFYTALLEAQSRLRDGTAEWHTFEEVFSD